VILLLHCPSTYTCSFFPVFGKFIYALIDSEETIRYSTRRVLEDFEADGVVYLELRTGPRAYPARSITKDDYVRIILETIAAYHSDRMVTKLILALDRKYSTIEQADEIANLTIKYAPQGVVGLDICGDPSAGDVSIFAPAFTKIREAGLHVTLHFGEVPNSGTVEELNALLSFQPERIGHVIYLPEEIQEEVKRRKLGLELCLSSNVKLKMISGTYSDHHFNFWRHTECPIVLCVGSQC
jgi:adenosine deaminase